MRIQSLILAVAVLATAGCARGPAAGAAPAAPGAPDAAAEAAIRSALDSTAAAWNRGDLKGYLAPYTPDATEMLRDGPAGGVEAIEKTMKEGFWKTGRPLQHLHYEHVWVRMLGRDGAVVTGQFVLTGGGQADRTGWFTTAWIRTRDGWRMVHDAS